MSFSDLLREKVEARRLHGSAVRVAAETLQEQAFERIRAVHDAVADMTARLARDPVFAAAFGSRPTPTFRWSADNPRISSLEVKGPVGSFKIKVHDLSEFSRESVGKKVWLQIQPDWAVATEIGSGYIYADATPVEGDTTDLAGFVVAVEDMLAEFLADAMVSPAGHRFLPGLE